MMEAFADELLNISIEEGCEAAEICIDQSESFRVKILNQEMDEYRVSWKSGIGLRVLFRGKNGYAYSETPDHARELVLRAIDNASTISTDDEQPMQTAQQYVQVQMPVCPLCAMTEQEKIELAMRMERDVLAQDDRVFQVPYCIVSTGKYSRHLKNTLGLVASESSEDGAIVIQAAVREQEEVHDGFAYREGKDALDVENCVREAVAKAVDAFGAASYPSGKTAVVLENEAAADLFGAFVRVFSADEAQHQMSPFAGKLGEKIAADVITIVDDPFYEKNPRAFDGEGTPSKETTVIEKGVFNSFLHNLKTAKKDGVESTSNASRPSPGAAVTVGPSNFYILPGKKTKYELLEEMKEGILITDVTGLHAGLNAVTGDFSLLASGFVVENGKRGRAVEQVTVAGNLKTLLLTIKQLANDLTFAMGPVGSPSLLIEELTIAGK